jgi:two-component system response regulator TctD
VAKVLLIDDDAHVARAVARVLRSHGMVTTVVATAAAGQAALTGARFDVVVCDLALGGDNGLVFLESMRKRGDQTPFVLITGYAGAERESAERDPRISAVLLKPFDAATLGRVLRDAMASSRVP